MIQVNELRIGNWVFDNSNYVDKRNKKPIVVETIWHNGIDVDTFYDGLIANIEEKYLEPILLTPEILEKCGFEFNDMADLCLSWEETIWIGEYDTKVKYLHQLQNLYFALTGTELNIEL